MGAVLPSLTQFLDRLPPIAGFDVTAHPGALSMLRVLLSSREEGISTSMIFLNTEVYFQNRWLAIRAPSAIAANLANTTSGSTAAWPTQVP